MTYPKVLIISNNPFSNESNMGKTLSNIFKLFPQEKIAQLYFRSGIPTNNIAGKYYSFGDKDALKSVFIRWHRGASFQNDFFTGTGEKRFNKWQPDVGRKKSPLVYFLRDFVWSISNFKNRKLLKWASNFDPDFVFFASGDSIFPYKNVLWITRKLKAKLVTMCFDDYYENCNYINRAFGKLYYSKFIKIAKKTISFSYKLLATNELMATEYSRLFGKEFDTIFTPSVLNSNSIPFREKKGISYIGGLGLNRHISLKNIGSLVASLNSDVLGKAVFIYANTPPKELLDFINQSSCLRFIGKASFKDVPNIISSSYAVIHTESFDADVIKRTRLSFSTKIAESLSSGTLLIAYGPKNIASMDYLVRNNCALVADNIEELKNLLLEILSDEKKYAEIINNANKTAQKNHSFEAVNQKLLNCLS